LSDTQGLTDLAIVGAPDDIRGEQVAAIIVSADAGTSTAVAAELARTASEGLAGYKRPRLYFHAAALPRDPTGKLLRNALRDEVAQWHRAPSTSSLLPIGPVVAEQNVP
jgi:acyl-coenzyme A synthetase/AMP-(fatty) acid ligase